MPSPPGATPPADILAAYKLGEWNDFVVIAYGNRLQHFLNGKLTADVKSLALQDVYGRVANVLMDLSEERGDGTLYIPEKLTQQDIADRVGASREMVARILKDLTIGEYIRFEGRHIIINTRLPAKY